MGYSNYPLIGIVSIAGCITTFAILAVAHPVWFAVATVLVVARGA